MTHWEEIHGFTSPGEYDRFVRYIEDQVSMGVAREREVDPRYGKDMIFGGRWFEYIGTQEVWRLVAPDFPFRGLWERLKEYDGPFKAPAIKHAEHLCPACGFPVGFAPWVGLSASDEMCPCCLIQFGYDDYAEGDLRQRLEVYASWRRHWIAAGMPWKSKGRKPPPDWDPSAQLSRITR
jgi:hypothetical protein